MITPTELRQIAASRLPFNITPEWITRAESGLTQAAYCIEQLERELHISQTKLEIYRNANEIISEGN